VTSTGESPTWATRGAGQHDKRSWHAVVIPILDLHDNLPCRASFDVVDGAFPIENFNVQSLHRCGLTRSLLEVCLRRWQRRV